MAQVSLVSEVVTGVERVIGPISLRSSMSTTCTVALPSNTLRTLSASMPAAKDDDPENASQNAPLSFCSNV